MSGFIKKRLLFLQEKIQENKKLKGDDLWKDLINGIHEDIKKEKLKYDGFESRIIDLLQYKKKYNLDHDKYMEIFLLSETISKLICNCLYSVYNKDEINILTKCILEDDYQKVLFEDSVGYDSSTSPEHFFANILWGRVISLEKLSEKQNNNRFDTWVKNNAFWGHSKKDRSDIQNQKVVESNAYYITFLVLNLILRMDPNLGYDKFCEFVEKFKRYPEIVFVLYYVMFCVLRNLNNVNCTYFNQNNDLSVYRNILKDFYQTKSEFFLSFDKNNIVKKFKKSFKNTVVKIVYDNCKEHQHEFYNVECTMASMIMGDVFHEDSVWHSLLEQIEQLSEEVFVR